MNYFFKKQLEVIAMEADIQEKSAQKVKKAIREILLFECGAEYYRITRQYKESSSPKLNILQINQSNGAGNQQIKSPKEIIEEIKAMIVELHIKGSVRERANGLIELRTQALGSIYGRTKDEIEQKLNLKLKEAKAKKQRTKKQKTPLLSEFFNTDYLAYKKTELSQKSLEAYEQYIKRIANEGFDKPLNSYTAREIEQYLLSIPQTRTRQVIRGVFNNIFSYAKRMGIIKTNPCDNVLHVKHERKVGRALSFDAQNSLFDSLYSNDTIDFSRRAFITFVYLTGARRSEALSLRSSDVDFEKKVLHIPGTKTKGSNRYMPLSPIVELLLRKLPKDADGRYFPFGGHTSHDIMEKVADEYHLHELRHTFGTIAICVRKLDAKTVSLYMGHSTVNMTLTTYTHPEQLNQALFYDGSKTEDEKLAIMQAQYEAILRKIESFLA